MLKDSRTQIAHPHVDIQKMEQDLSKTGLSEEENICVHAELLNHRSACFCGGPNRVS